MQNNPKMGRVLLAMDVSPRSRTALETAAALATQLGAELAGLFVEDVNLLRVGGLPFTREFGFFSGGPRTIDIVEIEDALRREAEEAERLLAETATRLKLRWSFHIARGQIAEELFALASELDLVVLGSRARMGIRSLEYWPVDALADEIQRSREIRPVVAVYDSSASARRALELAQQLALSSSLELRVLVPGSNNDQFSSRASEARALLADAGITSVVCRRIPLAGIRELATELRREKPSVLLLGIDGRFRSGEGFATLLNELDCPVVLVRAENRSTPKRKRTKSKGKPR